MKLEEVKVKKAILAHKKELEEGVKIYVSIMRQLRSCDVSKTKGFQTTYNGFYRLWGKGMNANTKWYDSYYSFMQEHKNDNALTFEKILRYLCEASGKTRVDASFSSKLLHTVNPDMPIWDSHVLKALGIEAPESYKDKEIQIGKSVETYDHLVRWYDERRHSGEAKRLAEAFDEAIPGAQISETKKVDWVLWALGC